jgi:hypothetical protein
MNRAQFEHTIRAAGAVLAIGELLVIGSQALHASMAGDLPDEASRSVEVDVAVFEDTNARGADLIDGSIGEASMFHSTFGYYAHGVAETTAILPSQWRERLVRFETPATSGVVAWCLEPHDLWISKAIAGRHKDLEFCSALLSLGVVNVAELSRRLADVGSINDRVRTLVQSRIDRG